MNCEGLLDSPELSLDVVKHFIDLPSRERLLLITVMRSILDGLDHFEDLLQWVRNDISVHIRGGSTCCLDDKVAVGVDTCGSAARTRARIFL